MEIAFLMKLKRFVVMLGMIAPVLATSETINLKYGLDFSTLNTNNTLTSTSALAASGTTIVQSGWANYRESNPSGTGMAYSSYGNDNITRGGTYTLGDKSSNILGLSASDGITLNISSRLIADADWKGPIAFIYGGTTFALQYMSGNNVAIRNETAGNNVLTLATDELTGAWMSYSITMQGDSFTLSVVNSAGDIRTAAGSVAGLDTTSSELTYVTPSGFNTGYDRRHENILTEDLTIYDGLLSQSDILAVAASSFAGSAHIQSFDAIPEPSTATLGLLALSGLVMRRRRRA